MWKPTYTDSSAPVQGHRDLKLKGRQKKLRVLRHDVMSDAASDELLDFVADY